MTLDPDFHQDGGVGGATALVAWVLTFVSVTAWEGQALVALGPDVRQDDGVGGVVACVVRGLGC